ncbi:MAG: VWA domain-containing protein [Anaerolineales bacterium]|nr:VWA domain-containing protein [Anaerolineales bacterium]
MKRNQYLFLIALLLPLVLAFPESAAADGIIIPEPPSCWPDECPVPICPGPFDCPPIAPTRQLAIRYHHVGVNITDQVAITHVDQVFFNPNNFQVEGTYIFPLPSGAVVTSFTMWVDGEPVKGEILEAEAAREKYEEIVRNIKDPALLEYVNQSAVQAHIFPIPPKEERRVELEYSQVLSAENELVKYVYPLNTEKFSLWPLDSVSVSVDIQSKVPLRAVYSSSHDVDVTREDEHHISVGYEEQSVIPDKDFVLYYSLGEEQAFHLMTFRDPYDQVDNDGFFMLLLTPRPDAKSTTLAKDIILVLDKSGSMEGEKFKQAQEALKYILEHLNPEDRFNIITFSTGIKPYAQQMRPASDAYDAQVWVDGLSAEGSTDINRALLEAAVLTNNERPTYLIFLTDGLPTEGVVDSQQIINNFKEAATKNIRLFAFGVGFDVDTYLLDTLAQAHHGASSYVLPGENLEESLSSFYTKISTPVLTNLELDFGELTVYDIYPSPLPDLFAGSQLVIVGRYRKGGAITVTLTGQVDKEVQKYTYQEQIFSQKNQGDDETLNALPRLWATRKIGYLLNKIRLDGNDQETIDQIVRLSIRYGIVTPYTSYLVTEPLPLGVEEQERIAGEQYNHLQAMPTAAVSGQAAVQKAADEGAMAEAEAPISLSNEAADIVKIVGARTFVLSDSVWTDTSFEPGKMDTKKIAFLSDDYFTLSKSRSELADAFALGERVIVVYEGVAYEVVSAGSDVDTVEIPPTYTPSPSQNDDKDTPQTTPNNTQEAVSIAESTQPLGKSSGLPCIAGMLPMAVLGIFGFVKYRRSLMMLQPGFNTLSVAA